MSRSNRAWTESCALVRAAVRGAGKLGKLEVEAHLGYERLPGTARSLTRLSWLAAAALLVLAFAPAVSLAGAGGSPHSTSAATHVPPRSRRAQNATRSAARSSEGHARRLLARGGTSSAESLVPGAGYFSPHGSGPVRELQRRLTRAGYAPGATDGRYGPLTGRAVVRFQAASGLQVDGIAGPRTLIALASAKPVLYPGSGNLTPGSGSVRSLQRRLARAGYAPGPVDGRYGPLTERAVIRFQAAHGLHVDGIAGPQTLERLPVQGAPRPQVHRQSHPVRSRPGRPHRLSHPVRPHGPYSRSTPAVAPPNADRARRPSGSSSITWLVLLALLVLALVASVSWHARRRRNGTLLASQPTPNHGEQRGAVGHGAVQVPSDPDTAVAQSDSTDPPKDARDRAIAAFDLNEGVGDLVGAESAYRRADERGDANGAFNLGVLLEGQGDLTAAKAAYQRADQRGQVAAACNLGVLLEEQGDIADAESAYRRADERGDANGAFNLGVLLEQQGDLTAALMAFRRAGQRGSPEVAELAHATLLELDKGSHDRGIEEHGGGHDGQ